VTEDASWSVERLAALWQAPDPDACLELWHPEGTMLHPTMEAALPVQELPAYLRELLAPVPDMRSTVERWTANDRQVYIEWVLSGTLGGPSAARSRR
jgi:hypothetical protein